MSNAQLYNLPYNPLQAPVVLNHSFSLGWVPIYFLGYYIHIEWSGTPNGTFYLDASGDQYTDGNSIAQVLGAPFYTKPSLGNPGHDSIISGSSYSVSAAGKNAWNVNGIRYNFVRVSYTDLSAGASTAILNYVNVSQKGPG